MDGEQKSNQRQHETPEEMIKRVFAVAKLLANAAEYACIESRAAPEAASEKPQKTQDREMDLSCR